MALNPPYQSTIKSLLSQPSLTGTRTMKTWRAAGHGQAQAHSGTGTQKRVFNGQPGCRTEHRDPRFRARVEKISGEPASLPAWRRCPFGAGCRPQFHSSRPTWTRRVSGPVHPGPSSSVVRCTSRPMPPSVPSSPLSLSSRPSPEPRGDSAPAGQARRRDARSPRPRAPLRAAAGLGRGLRVGCAGERRPSGHHAPAVVLG